MAIDAQNNVYVESSGRDVYSFASGGRLRWTWTSAENLVAGPLLTSNDELIVATADASQGWDHATHLNFVVLDAATGSKTATYPLNAHLSSAGFSVLLTSAEQLVLISDGYAMGVAAARTPSADAQWPTPSGGVDNRGAALGK
jgi:hypothetical protein